MEVVCDVVTRQALSTVLGVLLAVAATLLAQKKSAIRQPWHKRLFRKSPGKGASKGDWRSIVHGRKQMHSANEHLQLAQSILLAARSSLADLDALLGILYDRIESVRLQLALYTEAEPVAPTRIDATRRRMLKWR
ncbi:hypothetical protein PYCC9005_005343 [Savitreella phatthalungensis]